MDDTMRYAKVLTMLCLVLAATAIGVRNSVSWALSGTPVAWAADDRHLRLSIEEGQDSEDDDQPYKGGKFQAQYEKL